MSVVHTFKNPYYGSELEALSCWCGIVFAAPATLVDRCRNQGGANGYGGITLHCPVGHSNVWRETEADKLRKELAAEQQRKANALQRANEAEQRAVKAERKIRRHEKRAKVGVCPCCNRTFQQLQRHMATKHPDYAK